VRLLSPELAGNTLRLNLKSERGRFNPQLSSHQLPELTSHK